MPSGDGQVVFSVELDDTAFQAGLTRLSASISTLGEQVYQALSLSGAQLTQAQASGAEWAQRMAAGIGASKSVSAALRMLTAGAAAANLGSAKAQGASVGQALTDGIISGASGRGGALNAALRRIVQNALAAAKHAAGIASPSKLFRDEVGQYLALGVQSGFQDTMRASVLPAMARSVAQSAAAGRTALDGTLLSAVRQAAVTPLTATLPTAVSGVTISAAASRYATGNGMATGGDAVTNVTQNITFAAPMQAPDEVARAMRRQATYGLAGARA